MQDPTGRQRQGFPPRAQCFHLPQGAIPLSDITQQVWEEDEAISLSTNALKLLSLYVLVVLNVGFL